LNKHIIENSCKPLELLFQSTWISVTVNLSRAALFSLLIQSHRTLIT
ncbi:hypothetical protein SeLEV6574_g08569, partial [Synchytrium endobioticum]